MWSRLGAATFTVYAAARNLFDVTTTMPARRAASVDPLVAIRVEAG